MQVSTVYLNLTEKKETSHARPRPHHAFTGHTQKNRLEYILEVTLSFKNLNYVGLIFQIGTILQAF